jgi:two-component system LytT family response regulator
VHEVDVGVRPAGGGEALSTYEEFRPDLVFLDVQMPDQDGFAVIEASNLISTSVPSFVSHS